MIPTKKWKNYFKNFDICLDFNSIEKKLEKNITEFHSYDHFYNLENYPQSLWKNI